MMQCVLGSFISLFWAILFLMVLLMICSLIAVQNVTNWRIDHPNCQELDGEDLHDMTQEECEHMKVWFGSVGSAMLSMFMGTTGGIDWGDLYATVKHCGPTFRFFFLFYIVFFNFAFFNIVTSVFVDKAMKLAKPDEETLLAERKQHDLELDQMLRELFNMVDDDDSGVITIDELQQAIEDARVLHKFELLGISVRDADTFFHTLTAISHGEDLRIDEFVEGCLKLKGPASSLDVQYVRSQVEEHQRVLNSYEEMKLIDRGRESSPSARGLPSARLGSARLGSARTDCSGI